MSALKKSCRQCGAEHSNETRLVVELCGHQKCRQCFLREDDCCFQCQIQNGNSNIEVKEKAVELSNVTQIDKSLKDDEFASTKGTIVLFDERKRPKKKYKCSECQKFFSKLSYLKYHLESHLLCEHHCSYCYKVFNNRLVLKKHENTHRTHPIPCSHCGKILCSKNSLSNHIARKHTHVLEYVCNMCSKAYPSKSSLNQHVLKHEAKKYYCNQCGKGYQRNSTLNSHIKRHNKIQVHQCYKCNKNFSDAISCKRHEQQHGESFKFRCKHCEIITLRKDNMMRHIRNFHVNFTYQESVDIINPALVNVSRNHSPDYDRVFLKTVENSTVIKCVGNVEPVVVPSIGNSNEHDISELHSGFGKEADNIKCHYAINQRQLNIDLYRRILEDDPNLQGSVKVLQSNIVEANVKDLILSNSELEEKPAPLHWRKNFKNNYELAE